MSEDTQITRIERFADAMTDDGPALQTYQLPDGTLICAPDHRTLDATLRDRARRLGGPVATATRIPMELIR